MSNLNIISIRDAKPYLGGEYIIKGVLGAKSIACMLGASGEGKSATVGHMAAHSSIGQNWFGHRTVAVSWLIVHLEGFAAAANRFAALKADNPTLNDADVEITDFPLNLMERRSCVAFVKAVKERQSERGKEFRALAIDTFNAAAQGIKENEAGPVGVALSNVRYLRDKLNVAVLLVHHLGKDPTKGARGHSSFHAALDTELTIERSGDVRILKATKQRDFETGNVLATYTLAPIVLGRDSDGDAVTSVVIRPADTQIVDQQRPAALKGKAQKQILAAVRARNVGKRIWSLPELREVGRELGLSKSTARSAVETLVFTPFFVATVGGYVVADRE